MKSINYFFMSIFALLFFVVGCNDDNDNNGPVKPSDPGSLRISLQGTPLSLDDTRAAGIGSEGESTIFNFTVFVFNSNTNTLEKTATVGGETTITITGLSTTTPKRIVVVANTGSGFPALGEGDPYSELEDAVYSIPIENLNPTYIKDNGLVMIGEKNPVTITADATNQEEIMVKRVAAKIILSSIRLDNEVLAKEYDFDKFTINAVSVQRAISKTNIFGKPVDTPVQFAGGIANTAATNNVQTFLLKSDIGFKYGRKSEGFVSGGYAEEIGEHFYVLPHANPATCTLITYHAQYGDKTYYLPVKINPDNIGVYGPYVVSNVRYIVYLMIKGGLTEGSEDPDTPVVDADFSLKAIPAAWGMVQQNEVWE